MISGITSLNTVYAAAPGLFLPNVGMLLDAHHDILQRSSLVVLLLNSAALNGSDSTDSRSHDCRLSPNAKCNYNFSFVLLSLWTALRIGFWIRLAAEASRRASSMQSSITKPSVPSLPYRPTLRTVPLLPWRPCHTVWLSVPCRPSHKITQINGNPSCMGLGV